MALSITDLKKGTIFAIDGTPYKVLEYKQKVMGRGGSTVNVKIKSLSDGKVLAKTFHGNDQVDDADVSMRPMQFLYADDVKFYLMDPSTYEQLEMPTDKEALNFIKEGDQVTALVFNGQVISLELPKNVPLEVTYTEGAVKGDTSSAITKNATTETGLVVKVPAFIKTGDLISVNTETGEYRERVK